MRKNLRKRYKYTVRRAEALSARLDKVAKYTKKHTGSSDPHGLNDTIQKEVQKLIKARDLDAAEKMLIDYELAIDIHKGTTCPSCMRRTASKDFRTCARCGKAKGCIFCFVVADAAIDSYWCPDCCKAAKKRVSSDSMGGIMTCPNCGAKGLMTTDLKDCSDCGRTGCVKCFEDEFCQPCDDARARKVLAIVDPVKAAASRNPVGDLAQAAEEHARKKETVNHPAHYNVGKIEVIAAIDDWKLGFCLGNAVKYIARAGHKGDALEDLKKAAWYLQHEIDERQKQKPNPS